MATSTETRRAPKPNYAKIHQKPLPLDTFPLPPLIPHNPFSLVQIAIAYYRHFISPPCSHAGNRVRGRYSPETAAVHVTDKAAIRLLWERGFFGKGSLSRSEPTWQDREKKRLGLLAKDTSEEYTRLRREERRKMKLERARKERQVIEEGLQLQDADGRGEAALSSDRDESISQNIEGTRPEEVAEGLQTSIDTGAVELRDTEADAEPRDAVGRNPQEIEQIDATGGTNQNDNDLEKDIVVVDEENLQLTPEEAFFLSFGLGTLDIMHSLTMQPISPSDQLDLFRAHSYSPPMDLHSLCPDDPFLTSYAAYHYFRSLGWVVRPGIKFAVDWLLYLRGPAFSHAEFAVMVMPSYRHSNWHDNPERANETAKKEHKDWWWLHCLQRVQAQVRKGLVLCWVEIPPPDVIAPYARPKHLSLEAHNDEQHEEPYNDITMLLKQYIVHDMIVKRWIPNRSRD